MPLDTHYTAVAGHRGEPLLNEFKALREWLRQRRNDGSDYLSTSQKGAGRGLRSHQFRCSIRRQCEHEADVAIALLQ
jgi:hypothetical protein